MTAYQVLPGLTADEYAALRDDITAHGVRVPVDVDENGQVLDGHHRSLIATELGIDCPRRTVAGLSEAEKIAHALAVNVHRRSLSRDQRRELLATSIRAEPSASDREHARRVGTSDKTAGAVRQDLERRAEIPHVPERTDSAGRQQPASKPTVVTPVPTTRDQFLADRETGEVLSPEDWHKQQETAQLETQLEDRLSSTDSRFLANLARGIQANNHLLELPPERTADLCNRDPDSDDLANLLGFLNRMETWTAAVRKRLAHVPATVTPLRSAK